MHNYNISYFILTLSYAQLLLDGPRRAMRVHGYTDNVNPREILAQLEAAGNVPAEEIGRLKRRAAAQSNGFESMALMAAATVAGNAANLGPTFMNVVSVCYFVFRIVFVQLYVRTTTQKGSIWRSVAWVLCTLCWFVTFWVAGVKLNHKFTM